MLAIEKVSSALQSQTDQIKINSRVIIPQRVKNRPTCQWMFLGNVMEFRQYLKAQKMLIAAWDFARSDRCG